MRPFADWFEAMDWCDKHAAGDVVVPHWTESGEVAWCWRRADGDVADPNEQNQLQLLTSRDISTEALDWIKRNIHMVRSLK